MIRLGVMLETALFVFVLSLGAAVFTCATSSPIDDCRQACGDKGMARFHQEIERSWPGFAEASPTCECRP